MVIVDEMMPQMRGTELARQVIQIKDDIPVVLITGYGSLIPEDEVRSSGIRATLTKPVSRDRLKTVLDSLSIHKKSTQS
jgi:CheY-like chemotaxis protein